MAIQISFNGTNYSLPETGETDWGDELTNFNADLAASAVTKTGTQVLTNKTLNSPTINTPIVLFAQGSVTSPSITFNGDADTGLFNSAANTISLTTGGVERLTLGTSSLAINVGTQINGALDVSGALTQSSVPVVTTTGIQSLTNKSIDATSLKVNGIDAVTLSGVQTLTNKTLNGAVLNGTIGSTTPATGSFTSLTASSATVGGNAVVTANRSVATGTGLTGGGNLSADRTLSLTGQALAFHNLATDGLVIRSGSSVVSRSVSGTANRITVTNGDGVAGNPTLDIGSDVVTLNGSQTLLNKTLSGASITSSTINGLTLPTGSGSSGQVLTSNGSGGVTWSNTAGTGTVTSVTAGAGLAGGTITSAGTIDLAASGVAAGTYTAPTLTVDAYGRITVASSGSYATLGSNSFVGQTRAVGGGVYLPDSTSIAQAGPSTGLYDIASLKVEAPGFGATVGASFMSFHRPGAFGVHLGLDTDNKLKIGGWSLDTNAYEIWHAGNAPLDTSATANTVVRRGGDGSIAGYGIFGAAVALSGASPNITMTETDGAVDGKLWVTSVNGGVRTDYIANDANSVSAPWRTITRSGNAVTALDYKVVPTYLGTQLAVGTADTNATPNTVAKRTGDGSLVGNHLYAKTSDGSSNGVTLVAIGNTSDALDSYFQMNSSANTSLAGGRSLNLVVNTGGFGIYTGRLSPSPVLVMDSVSKALTLYKAMRAVPVALTDSTTISFDFNSSNYFTVTLGGNRTLANPSNPTAGQGGSITIRQDGTGSRTLSFGSYWKFSGGSAPTLSTAPNAVDKLIYEVVSPTEIHATLIKDFK